MKRLYFLLIVLLALTDMGRLFAQDNYSCGTTLFEQASTPEFVTTNAPFNLPPPGLIPHEVPVQFHIIGAFNGALAIDSAVVFRELELANDVFADINIEFVHCGLINYINDNEYVTFTKGLDEVICDQEDAPGAINIYFALNVENAAEESICGYAYNFDIKNRMVIDNGCADNGSTLIHELGHSFSLLHTHSTSNGEELVDGSNCITAGDLICDTPADPRLNTTIVDENCVYIGSEIDLQEQEYAPDTRNLMSYSRKECRTHFSQQQLNMMATFYLLEGGLLYCDSDPVSTATPLANDLSIYPNPSGSQVYIQGLNAPANIRVTDTKGSVYLQYTLSAQSAPFAIPEFSQFPAGMYFLLIQFNNGERSTHRLIKQ